MNPGNCRSVRRSRRLAGLTPSASGQSRHSGGGTTRDIFNDTAGTSESISDIGTNMASTSSRRVVDSECVQVQPQGSQTEFEQLSAHLPQLHTQNSSTDGEQTETRVSPLSSSSIASTSSSSRPESTEMDTTTATDVSEPRQLMPSTSTTSSESQECRMERVRRRWRCRRGSYPLLPGVHSPEPVKGQSYCECPKETRDIECRCGEEDNAFDWVWDKNHKSSATDLSEDGRDARFHVNYSSGTAAARGSKPMTDRQYFWEIKMVTPVYGTDMMVGIGTPNVDMDAFRHNFCSFLGRDGESWGHSYNGRMQHKGKFIKVPGARFGQGSIIGMHLDMWHGSLCFYKNRKPLEQVFQGLAGKQLYPMVSSTAARTGMRIIKACSFKTSLQFMCCQVLRRLTPQHLSVLDAIELPPGLHAFLMNNLSWLLRPSELAKSGTSRKRKFHPVSDEESGEEADEEQSCKRARTSPSSDDEESDY